VVCRYDAPMQSLIFDLDGTLVDTVYAHVLAAAGAFGAYRDAGELLAHLDELGIG
jgi:beta-phosphoglucomutase-like phosphatase (HAD superfamily)